MAGGIVLEGQHVGAGRRALAVAGDVHVAGAVEGEVARDVGARTHVAAHPAADSRARVLGDDDVVGGRRVVLGAGDVDVAVAVHGDRLGRVGDERRRPEGAHPAALPGGAVLDDGSDDGGRRGRRIADHDETAVAVGSRRRELVVAVAGAVVGAQPAPVPAGVVAGHDEVLVVNEGDAADVGPAARRRRHGRELVFAVADAVVDTLPDRGRRRRREPAARRQRARRCREPTAGRSAPGRPRSCVSTAPALQGQQFSRFPRLFGGPGLPRACAASGHELPGRQCRCPGIRRAKP